MLFPLELWKLWQGKRFFEEHLFNPQRQKGTSQFSQKWDENLGIGLESEIASVAVLWVDASHVRPGGVPLAAGRATSAAVSALPLLLLCCPVGSREGKGSGLPGASCSTGPWRQFSTAG